MLGWFELQEEDRPPERIWLDDEATAAFFEAADARREAKARGETAVPAAEMQENELTAQFRKS